ncbi:LuxR C-terminal-related transcriptional regulator [Mumia quercus]|uniref:LuxR C-terminal-related transcriptional regulator n=1 Tax=Mumia quercus TaxID=2976125 RepID=UPI0021CFD76B|nr:LuxR C-terminal-related transcriptional regulator [Mumia quercus]
MAATKGGYRYAVPRLPRPLARRPRLSERLASAVPLVVVRGPVGIGKSTLVAQWFACIPEDLDAAWVTLDEEVHSATRLWEEIGRALAVAGVVTPFGDGGTSRRAIRHAVQAWQAPLVVVVERYEQIRDSEADRGIAELLRSCPNLRVVVCARDDMRLREACRLQGVESDVIGVRDLLLTRDETQALFESFGLVLDRQQLDDLHRETGGWPAILWAIGDALAHEPSPWTQPVDEVVREHAHDWVRNQVLSALAPVGISERVFRFTVLEQFDDDVARFVNGGVNPRSVIDCLVSHGLLMPTPVGTRRSYAWPRLVRSAMLSLFATEMPHARRTLEKDLAGWFLERGDHARALTHALAGGDLGRAAAAVEDGWLALLAGHHQALEAFFESLPAADLARRRKLRTIKELSVSLLGAPAGSQGTREVLGRTELELIGRSTDARTALDDGLLALLSLRLKGDPAQAREVALRLTSIATAARTAHPDEVDDLLCPVFKEAGVVHLLAGETQKASDSLLSAYETSAECVVPGARTGISAVLGLTFAVEGDFAAGDEWIAQHGAEACESPGTELLGSRLAHTAQALLAAERLDRCGAYEALERESRSATPPSDLWFYDLFARAQTELLWGDRIGVLHQLSAERARRAHGLEPGSFAEALLVSLEVDLLLSLRATSRAGALLATVTSEQPLVDLARARLALAIGDHAAAQRVAGGRRWDESCSRRVRADLKLTYAAALLADGRTAVAVPELTRLLTLADSGVYRPFALVPRDLLVEAADVVPAMGRVIDVLDASGIGDVLPRQVEFVELTPREEVVLAALATDRSLEEIARTLYVSVNTVKTQTRSLYRKLGVRSREEAVQSAAVRGMLPPAGDAAGGPG